MTHIHTEGAFEATIEQDLLTRCGYVALPVDAFTPANGLFPSAIFAFLERSQPEAWKRLRKYHGATLETTLLDAIVKEIHHRGRLDVLRHGLTFYGEKLRAACFKPAHGLNPETERLYGLNQVAVTRQVPFHPGSHETLDMVLSINGIPVVTMELKNPLTGQTFRDAVAQYQDDRDPRHALLRFKTGALVHLAVDPDEVRMTTHLDGKGTRFLPLNRGDNDGAGNPVPADGGYKTAYLWREVLQADSLLDIVARFVHLLAEERKHDGKVDKRETLVFPRYHQLDCVRRLEASARADGPGHHYLVQHSAGSGKSNSIAWTAHRLASLHDAQDDKVFHSVVVITDRKVLDRQLQDTIYQFEHKAGVVACIDKDSAQLAQHLANGTPIIVTTLQKFPFVSEKIGALPDRAYAIIVDEAHSSQTGESAGKLKAVLALRDPEAEDDEEATSEDEINRVMAARKRQPNLSFFAFTATPKGKTLELFGIPGHDGKPRAFHLYSMRQAIEEGFILDVLRNYTTYSTYYRLVKTSADDPDVKKREAASALARFVSLHPSNIAQKVEVIVEHFRAHVRHRIGGRAKAMVVTRSRLHAVRYKMAIDRYLKERHYADMQALVAFSGEVEDPDLPGDRFTECSMNPGQKNEQELPRMFASSAYQVLIVANKYQTGFDEPLLHTMYLDRRLSGVQAVQTLSRLNRTAPGKVDTFVLDFVNRTEEIRSAFQPFYEATTVAERADPQHLNVLRHDLDKAQIWWDSELEAFAAICYKPPGKRDAKKDHEQMYRHLQPAKDRFAHWQDEEAKEVWRDQLGAFVRLYAFLSQVIPYSDRDLEVRHAFGRHLLAYLDRPSCERYEFTGVVELEYLARPKEVESGAIALEAGQEGEMKLPTEVGTPRPKDDDTTKLTEIIDHLNERFGTSFQPEDRLFIHHAVMKAKAIGAVVDQVNANTFEQFALAASPRIEGWMIDGFDAHQDLTTKYLDDPEFKKAINLYVARQIYNEVRTVAGG